jgi:F-type H+-transporting ATPase subunit b
MDALQKLGIDGWSVVLYVVNTLLLVVILSKLLYKPILRFLDERRETIRRNLTEVEHLRKTFEAETERQRLESQEATKQLHATLAAMKLEAETKAQTLITEAEKRRDSLIEEARAQVDASKARLIQDVESDIQLRITQIVSHILEERIPKEVVQSSVQGAWKDFETKKSV